MDIVTKNVFSFEKNKVTELLIHFLPLLKGLILCIEYGVYQFRTTSLVELGAG